MNKGKFGIFAGQSALAVAVLFSASGCEATFTPEPVVVAYRADVAAASVVPPDIYAYPRVYYGGTWVYLYDDRWYTPTPQGWRVYRQEPRELGRARTQIQRAPGATPGPDYAYPGAPSQPPSNPYPHETGRERRPR